MLRDDSLRRAAGRFQSFAVGMLPCFTYIFSPLDRAATADARCRRRLAASQLFMMIFIAMKRRSLRCHCKIIPLRSRHAMHVALHSRVSLPRIYFYKMLDALHTLDVYSANIFTARCCGFTSHGRVSGPATRLAAVVAMMGMLFDRRHDRPDYFDATPSHQPYASYADEHFAYISVLSSGYALSLPAPMMPLL